MDKMIDSFVGWIKEKTGSPLYFTYIFFFITWNWKWVYILLFEDKESLGFAPIEYIEILDFEPGGYFLNFFINGIYHLLPPLILTLAAILWLPKLYAWAHRIHLDNHFKLKLAWSEKNRDFEREQANLLTEVVTQKTKQAKQKAKIVEIDKTQENERETELERLSKNPSVRNAMLLAEKVIYGPTAGTYTTNPSAADERRKYIQPNSLSVLDSYGLVNPNEKDGFGRQKMIFTETGKNLLRKTNEIDADNYLSVPR